MRNFEFRPILAASKPRDYTDEMFYRALVFPVIATPKLDGIRCVTRDLPRPPGHISEPLCRSLKPVPNDWTRTQIGTHCPPGLDGELMTYDRDLLTPERLRSFHQIQSDLMTFKGTPNFRYHVFDCGIESGAVYHVRLEALRRMFDTPGLLPTFCTYVQDRHCKSLDELLAYEEECVAAGYEGICFRDPNSRYKYGRSTLREGHLVKMKRFVAEEAVIIGAYEEMANNNPMTYNELGYAERSSHGVNMLGKGRLGGFIVKNAQGEFKVGSGFTAAQREEYWRDREKYVGKLLTFKHQPHGAKDLPRLPIFVGFRDERDMSE